MCGISGILAPDLSCRDGELRELVGAMTDRLARRGPDGEGIWLDASRGLVFGHRRLAIVDLSPTGAQPMTSASGRFVLVTNGEIYDHRRWRTELERAGVSFKGTSDTEVLLEAFERWGIVDTLRRVNGMFALAVWDREQHVLTLARDRVGERPLYYGVVGGRFAFASRLDSLASLPGFARNVDEVSVGSFLRFGFVPHPHTIFQDVRQLVPGSVLTVRIDGRGFDQTLTRWWSLDELTAGPRAERDLDALDGALRESVALRLQADVPAGVFLSGGVDSSLVTALGQQAGGNALRTFTVSVGTRALDEAERAARIARHVGTEHTTIELSDAEAVNALAEFVDAYDEPFADPSALPTLLLAREVRRHVTVALGGDGGDELFAGYNRHAVGAGAWRVAGRIPTPMRRACGRVLAATPRATVDRLTAAWTPHLGDKLVKLGGLLLADRDEGAWSALAPAWPGRLPWRGGAAPADPTAPPGMTSALDELRWLDTAVTLPDDMLVKVDRASMHWGLEARVPLLDPAVMAWAWSQRDEALVQRGRGKLPLRALLARYLPVEFTRGPKRGFDPPLAAWLRGPLRGWADERLAPDRIAATGWLDPEPVAQVWAQHLGGTANHDYRLWTVLSFVAWYERWCV